MLSCAQIQDPTPGRSYSFGPTYVVAGDGYHLEGSGRAVVSAYRLSDLTGLSGRGLRMCTSCLTRLRSEANSVEQELTDFEEAQPR